MKKLIVAIVAGFMLSFVGAPALAYEPTVPTDTTAKPTKKVKPGKKVRLIVKPKVQGDASEICTGRLVVVYKAGKKVTRQRSKPAGNRVAFNGKVPAGTSKIIFLYQRGKKDPCDKSKSSITV
ncbi:MAG: hypothetical protein KAG80_10895 [Nocardioides sp.]|nr:hypothetical protein [Nocardioides sp.]